MKLIFLDIDGVLNSKETFIKRKEIFKETGKYILEIDEKAVKRLSEIIENTSAKIVLSSTWRMSFKRENNQIIPINNQGTELENLLKKYNIEIFDMTPILYHNRELEITYWISHNSYIDSFIIIDDDTKNLELFKDIIVKTNFNVGLTDKNVYDAINILNKNKVKEIKNEFK